MVTKRISIEILENYTKSSPEFREYCKIKDEFKDFIIKESYNRLTPAEKEFIEKYPEKMKKQESIRIGDSCFIPYYGDFIRFNSYFENTIKFDDPIPYLFYSNGYYSRITEEDTKFLGEDFVDTYKDYEKRLEIIFNRYYEKEQLIEDLLKDKDIKLKDIKEYYPKLYNYYENSK